MISTIKYKEQHIELLDIMARIGNEFNSVQLLNNAIVAHSLFITLSKKLKLHLGIEDKFVYPLLMNCSNEQIKNTSKKFYDELGDISNKLITNINKWSDIKKISANPAEFISDMRSLLNNIKARIEKEDEELYPLLDKIA